MPKNAEFFTLYEFKELFTIKPTQRTLSYTSKFPLQNLYFLQQTCTFATRGRQISPNFEVENFERIMSYSSPCSGRRWRMGRMGRRGKVGPLFFARPPPSHSSHSPSSPVLTLPRNCAMLRCQIKRPKKTDLNEPCSVLQIIQNKYY